MRVLLSREGVDLPDSANDAGSGSPTAAAPFVANGYATTPLAISRSQDSPVLDVTGMPLLHSPRLSQFLWLSAVNQTKQNAQGARPLHGAVLLARCLAALQSALCVLSVYFAFIYLLS